MKVALMSGPLRWAPKAGSLLGSSERWWVFEGERYLHARELTPELHVSSRVLAMRRGTSRVFCTGIEMAYVMSYTLNVKQISIQG